MHGLFWVYDAWQWDPSGERDVKFQTQMSWGIYFDLVNWGRSWLVNFKGLVNKIPFRFFDRIKLFVKNKYRNDLS